MSIRVAIVIPWFGPDLKGGAEQQAWHLASRLTAEGADVVVLSTCSAGFMDDWYSNDLPAGESREAGIRIIRFKVGPRAQLFGQIINKLLAMPGSSLRPGISPLNPEEEEIFVRESINSDDLLGYLEKNKTAYDGFIFLPYLYGPALQGIPLVADRAILQPCLHDECYAYLDCVQHIFLTAGRIFFNSEGERELACRLYGPSVLPRSLVVGEGVELDRGAMETLLDPPLVNGPYLLSLGRRDRTKNTDLLLSAFHAFVANRNADFRLVLAGVGAIPDAPVSDMVVDMGVVDERQKMNLLKHCSALVNLSLNESFSRVVFEAWLAGKPVVVNRSCMATAMALKASGMAGWMGESEEEFVRIFEEIAGLDRNELTAKASPGRDYAQDLADWDRVVARYIKAIGEESGSVHTASVVQADKRIVQVSAGFAEGDAISEHLLAIRSTAISLGLTCDIYTEHGSRVDKEHHAIRDIKALSTSPSDELLYHHSIGCAATAAVLAQPAKDKRLIYHNITPAEFFEPYDKKVAALLRQGREALKSLAPAFPKSYGVSDFNRAELEAAGFREPARLPLVVDPSKWQLPPDPGMLAKLSDGMNILFVGRVSPNKCQHDLVRFFDEYRRHYGDGRLVLVGGYDPDSAYYRMLKEMIEASRYRREIILTGHVSLAELHACYRSASLFLSASEHEGFGVPLVEAMWFDVPVLAYKSTAIPEVLDSASLMFADKSDAVALAALLRRVIHDPGLRETIVAAQRRAREKHILKAVRGLYSRALFGGARIYGDQTCKREGMHV